MVELIWNYWVNVMLNPHGAQSLGTVKKRKTLDSGHCHGFSFLPVVWAKR